MRRLSMLFRRLLHPQRYQVVLSHRYPSGVTHLPGWPTSRARALGEFADIVRQLTWACGPDGRWRVRVLRASECRRLGIR